MALWRGHSDPVVMPMILLGYGMSTWIQKSVPMDRKRPSRGRAKKWTASGD